MKIHPLTIVYILLAFYFRMSSYVAFLLFSLLHEIGHYLAACYYQFDIQYMMILPFGAFLSLNDFGQHKVEEEIIMLISGPLVNLLFMIVFYILHDKYLFIINLFICIFNLLPIYPLDGSKLIHLLLSYFIDYIKVFYFQIRLSLLMIALGFVYIKSLGRIIVLMYLFYQNIIYIKNYRLFMIETILSDHNNKEHIKINHALKYYRPYNNFYILHQQFYDFDTVKINLIKSMKSH